jgi:hypothetical protein
MTMTFPKSQSWSQTLSPGLSYSLFLNIMKFTTTKIVLALGLALVAIKTNLFAEACDGHGHGHGHSHHHNHQHHSESGNENDTDLGCDEDDSSPNGLSSYEMDGRRTQSQFRVGNFQWGTRAAFEAAGARCVSTEPSSIEVQQSNDIVSRYRRDNSGGSNRHLQSDPAKQIPVYFHIIRPSNLRTGAVSTTQINNQIKVLNDSYEGIFEFTLKETDTTTNNQYYLATFGTNAEREMKADLRKGGTNALNIYTTEPYVLFCYMDMCFVCVLVFLFLCRASCCMLPLNVS